MAQINQKMITFLNHEMEKVGTESLRTVDQLRHVSLKGKLDLLRSKKSNISLERNIAYVTNYETLLHLYDDEIRK